MAADIDKIKTNTNSLCIELGKLGLIEENIQGYILSMDDANDRKEFIMDILTNTSDPRAKDFMHRLNDCSGQESSNQNNFYQKKRFGAEHTEKNKKESKQSSTVPNINVLCSQAPAKNVFHGESTPNIYNVVTPNQALSKSEEIGIGAKKKTKYVALYSKEGQAKSVIQLPGRHICECQAAKHKLINNCIQCGRVVCEQEGAGPCVFCGALVCTPEDQTVIDRGSRKGEKLRQHLMKGGGPTVNGLESLSKIHDASRNTKEGFEKALQHRDKLLEFDKNSVRRTQVIDDECDYYATDENQWLSPEDKEKLRRREEELRLARHGSRRDRKITFDFAGRKILDAEDDSAAKMYDIKDSVIQQVYFGKGGNKNTPQEFSNSALGQVGLQVKKSLSCQSYFSNIQPNAGSVTKIISNRIQDRELKEMSDDGLCLSMHQPWATLLVMSIKRHEGRTWYTAHRGRLWIASTAKNPSTDEIEAVEAIHRQIHNDFTIDFPKQYPTGSLLGCVNLEDCLSQDEYREQFPEGESASPFVFICSNPQQLIVKFPIKGKHKIYKLDQHIHQAAKKGLR
ncbi:unnamed protein product [Lymnaea stagnalis]|uniref:ASCH domain-containing protein n=1 Tax=Lymnaea stagnalis TaxID=6523 RepID=A0AAV2I1V8_LYMST